MFGVVTHFLPVPAPHAARGPLDSLATQVGLLIAQVNSLVTLCSYSLVVKNGFRFSFLAFLLLCV